MVSASTRQPRPDPPSDSPDRPDARASTYTAMDSRALSRRTWCTTATRQTHYDHLMSDWSPAERAEFARLLDRFTGALSRAQA